MLKLYPFDDLGPLFGEDAVFVPRTSFEPYGFFPGTDTTFDRRLCLTFPLFTRQQVLVPAGVLHPVCLELLERSRIQPLSLDQCLVYHNRSEFERHLQEQRPRSLIVDHPHPEALVDPVKYRVPRELLVRLVDKAYMETFLPAELLPLRKVVDRTAAAEADPDLWASGEGCFLKTTGPYLMGGGLGVQFADSPGAVPEALKTLPGSGPVVVEAAMPHETSYCVNLLFAEPPGSHVYLLGAAEQWFTEKNLFAGSRITPQSRVPKRVLDVAEKAASCLLKTDYVGMLGLDIIDREPSPLIVDLNPRSNFSTAPLFHFRTLDRLLGREMTFHAFHLKVDPDREPSAMACLNERLDRNQLFVLRAYKDPDSPFTLFMTVMCPVDSSEEMKEQQSVMSGHGLVKGGI